MTFWFQNVFENKWCIYTQHIRNHNTTVHLVLFVCVCVCVRVIAHLRTSQLQALSGIYIYIYIYIHTPRLFVCVCTCHVRLLFILLFKSLLRLSERPGPPVRPGPEPGLKPGQRLRLLSQGPPPEGKHQRRQGDGRHRCSQWLVRVKWTPTEEFGTRN